MKSQNDSFPKGSAQAVGKHAAGGFGRGRLERGAQSDGAPNQRPVAPAARLEDGRCGGLAAAECQGLGSGAARAQWRSAGPVEAKRSRSDRSERGSRGARLTEAQGLEVVLGVGDRWTVTKAI